MSSAVGAAVLRRHLMVWKVFAPRFMMAAVGLIAVDVAVVSGSGAQLAESDWSIACPTTSQVASKT